MHIKVLSPDEWVALRDVRLSALRDSPDAFLTTYPDELDYDESYWRSEFLRCDWHIGFEVGPAVALLGATNDIDSTQHERHLEYLWVSPEMRGRGLAFELVMHVLDRLRTLGVRRVHLWVLDGDDRAVRLYRRVGFVACNHTQPLASRPGRREEKMVLDLQ